MEILQLSSTEVRTYVYLDSIRVKRWDCFPGDLSFLLKIKDLPTLSTSPLTTTYHNTVLLYLLVH